MFKVILFLFYTALAAPFVLAQKSFTFQDHEVRPGTKHYFEIPIRSKNDSTFVPITVVHGMKPGPVLGITAGIHGYEYPPILAAQTLNQKINPKQISGTIILVQIANIPAFLGRSPFLNPQDGKNLNRYFPGNVNGSITELIAHTITEQVIARSDFFVDMHGGDAPEDLRSYNAWYHSDALPEVSAKGKEMALSMGFEYSIIFNVSKERLQEPSLYCSQEAFHRNIPAVDIECGKLGVPGKKETDQIVNGIFSLLKHLGMSNLYTETPSPKPTIISQRFTIKSKSTGLWYTEKKAGDFITKGEVVGYITDFFGKKLEEIQASQNGMILYMIGTPPINRGETIMNVGVIH